MTPQVSPIRQFCARKTFRINAAYLLTTLGDRMWMFAIGIFMHKLGGMTWVAVQQFFDAFVKLSILPIIGSFMDKSDRNLVMQRSLMMNNLAVAGSAASFCIVFIIAILLASFSRLASEAQRICFTKDWIVVITSSYPEEGVTLSQQNSFMSVIDQSASVVLPFLTGLLFDIFGWTISCITIIIYNLCSWYIESCVLYSVYKATPALQTRHIKEDTEEDKQAKAEAESHSWTNSFRLYFKQTSWMAGFGLALLYMTVLGFDNLAGSYGQKHGMSLSTLGLLRTCGSLFGVFGAISYGRIVPVVGLLWTTFIGLTWQNIFIAMSGASTLMPGSPMNVSGFVDNFDTSQWIGGVIDQVQNPENIDQEETPFMQLPLSIKIFFFGIMFARYGLWVADPAITQIQQETIPESQRYSVFAMQTAFCEAFSLLKDTIVIMFPNTELFGGLAIISCIFVFSGYMLNNLYFIKCGCSRLKTAHLNDVELQAIQQPERHSLLNGKSEEKPE
ncbi:unnamed protein product [Caenorhabditis bovis]|uniref:Solute carrier family 40 member n=1 Tax=Caenorhabditis bovis TaxID=2654633 RepID=A0A8S1F1J4_9PELO|nr:unnamed protein product [Caenorhabditis bovis]